MAGTSPAALTLACLKGPEPGMGALGAQASCRPLERTGNELGEGIAFPYSKQSCLGTLLCGNWEKGVKGSAHGPGRAAGGL